MIEIQGKYNLAKVFTDNIDSTTIAQIIELCNQPFVEGCNIRIMPDCHAGKGCVIGFTMNIKDKIIPNLVGVDIGCGMAWINLGKININLEVLDKFIHEKIPSGFNIHTNPVDNYKDELNQLRCLRDLKKSVKEFNRGIGSLGGGNHFIELNQDDEGNKYLVIHSGSRNIGKQVADYYQNKAFEYHSGLNEDFIHASKKLIEQYKAEGKRDKIQKALEKLKIEFKNKVGECCIPKDLCYLEGQLMEDYLHDMRICQIYAVRNREAICKLIMSFLGTFGYINHTIHNYIDFNDNPAILRKGAVYAGLGVKLLIPLNMRDGSLICEGLGNDDWNQSAPHGAGRILSRSQAKERIKLEDFQDSMKDIFTTSVSQSTIDESPFAYKPMEEIIDNIAGSTVKILKQIKPIYNFKAGGD
jgi:tRNA-splicing ligase RtcB